MWTTNAENFKNLPFKESRKEYLTRKYGDMWNLDKFEHSWYSTYTILAKRIAIKYKSFDIAFSKYCKLVPKWKQIEFLELFEGNYPEFFINEGNIIYKPRVYKRKKTFWIFRSIDYETGYMHKITKEIISRNEYFKRLSDYVYSSIYKENKFPYVEVIISGFEKVFYDYKDREFIRLRKEKHKQLKRK